MMYIHFKPILFCSLLYSDHVFQKVTMIKWMMNLVCVGKDPIYINEFSEWFSSPVAILSCTITYIEFTLYTQNFRLLHELLRPKRPQTSITPSIIII